MKYLKNFLVNSIFFSLVTSHVIKRGTGSIDDFTPYPEIKKLIEDNTKNYKYNFYSIFKDGPIYTGDATAYGSERDNGNCSFPTDEYYDDMMYAAINKKQYENDFACGACAVVISTEQPYNPIRIRVIDKCPECKHGDLDLSDKAFRALTNIQPSRKKITWALIPCDVKVGEYPPLVEPGSDIKFSFKEHSNKDYAEIKIYNTRYPVAKFFVKVDGKFVPMKRRLYNYWVREGHPALGPGPFDFRVELADGSVVEANGVELKTQVHDEDSIHSTGSKQSTSKSPGFFGYLKRLIKKILLIILIILIILVVLAISLFIYRKFSKNDSTTKLPKLSSIKENLPSMPKIKNPLSKNKPSVVEEVTKEEKAKAQAEEDTPKRHLTKEYADRLIM